MITPDLPGFRDAQVRLNQYMGNDVTFMLPASALTYPPNTPIDPQTGLALDPFVQPLTEIDFPNITVRARTIGPAQAANEAGSDERLGTIAEGEMWIRVPDGTYDPEIFRSRYFSLFGETYKVTRFVFGGMNAVVDHLYVHGTLTNQLDAKDMAPIPSGAVRVGPYYQEAFNATQGQQIFPTSFPFVSGTTEVYIDGVRQALGASYDYIEQAQSVVLSDNSINAGQRVVVAYQPS